MLSLTLRRAYFYGLLYRLLNEYCEIVLLLTEIVHLQLHDVTALWFFQDSFGRLHDRGKEVPKSTKLLTKLFPNKVTIHMPQVCIVASLCSVTWLCFINVLRKLINLCRMKRFLLRGSTNWIEILKPSKWKEIWITCAPWAFFPTYILEHQALLSLLILSLKSLDI